MGPVIIARSEISLENIVKAKNRHGAWVESVVLAKRAIRLMLAYYLLGFIELRRDTELSDSKPICVHWDAEIHFGVGASSMTQSMGIFTHRAADGRPYVEAEDSNGRKEFWMGLDGDGYMQLTPKYD